MPKWDFFKIFQKTSFTVEEWIIESEKYSTECQVYENDPET